MRDMDGMEEFYKHLHEEHDHVLSQPIGRFRQKPKLVVSVFNEVLQFCTKPGSEENDSCNF